LRRYYMPKGNERRKHKVVLVVEFDEKVNEREAVDAVNEAIKDDYYTPTVGRKEPGNRRGEYTALPLTMKVVRAERGDL
jgi:hypothetical protein